MVKRSNTGQKKSNNTADKADKERADRLFRQAKAYHQKGKLADAETLYRTIIAINPDHADALHLFGVIAAQNKNFTDALDSISKAIALNPTNAFAYNNRGNAYRLLKNNKQALIDIDKAIALKPEFADAWNNRGAILADLAQYELAVDAYNKAIVYQPANALAYNNRGNAYRLLGHQQSAINDYRQAISLNPKLVEAYINCGLVHRNLGQYQEALSCYEKAIALKPKYDFLFGMAMYVRMLICDWRDNDKFDFELAERIARGERVSSPFRILAKLDSPQLQLKAAQVYGQLKFPENQSLPKIPRRTTGERIRIGYFSADFHNHPVAYLIAELIEIHDRNKFEIIGFSLGPASQDDMRSRLVSAFDRFVDVNGKSDEDTAQMARTLNLDIAIDLGGYTQNSRTGIFALRAAPVQISYLGYLGSMGLPYMDYIIADKVLIPKHNRPHYTENILYLPSYQVNDRKRPMAVIDNKRKAFGLPEQGFVYCCFNNNYKITPSVYDSWMRILAQVDGSVLMLYAANELAETNLKQEAQIRGIEPSRIIFGQRLSHAAYLARFQAADLFLDTYPYNAGTTASDALWAGLPALTRMGEAFASRMAGSLLTAIGLTELITTSPTDYEKLAVELAQQPEKLLKIKQTLQINRNDQPLFDTEQFAKQLESAYRQLYDRCQKGLALSDIEIED
jgi:predicted O-linked N-acetylglucosamine transferase (SPINDLY family)